MKKMYALLCLLLSASLLSASAVAFSDVPEGSWYHDAVETMREQGLMNGVDPARFDPDGSTTRATIVTVLHRQAGSLAPRKTTSFADVPAGSWYAAAVAWAAENAVVNGYSSGGFGPNDPITREQMVAILYRYTAFAGGDVRARADLSRYSDAASVSAYARDAMGWAVASGLLHGVSDTELSPQGTATRAQTAAILARFLSVSVPTATPATEPATEPATDQPYEDHTTIELPMTD